MNFADLLKPLHFEALNTATGQAVVATALGLVLLVVVLVVGAMALVFRKAGRPAWAAFVPFYNLVVLARVAGWSGWWGLLAAIPFLFPFLWLAFSFSLARRFGRGWGLGLLTALVPLIGFAVMGLSELKYEPPAAAPTLPARRPKAAAAATAAVTEAAAGRKSWHGRRIGSSPRTKHRWQQVDWNEEQLADLRRREFYYRASLFLHWGAVFGLLGGFVYLLMLSQPKTLFYAIAGTSYRRPLPPNGWAVEDIRGFVPLHRATLDYINISSDWRNKEMGMPRLERELADAADDARRRNVLMLYVSMHGAVDGKNQACLLTPESNPTNSATWLPVATLLRSLREQLPERMLKVVVFDCTKQETNWSLGQTYNGFSDRLADAVATAKVRNLVVISASGSNELAWTAPELRGSVFGHFFRKAMSGDADRPDQLGNGDRLVQISELEQYLRHHVDQWVTRHRHDRQRPIVIRSSGVSDFAAIACHSGASFFTAPENGAGKGPLDSALAAASAQLRYTPAPSITTPAISGPHLGATGVSPPMITRPTFSVPPVNMPGMTSQSYTFPLQIPAGAKPDEPAPEKDAPPPPPNPLNLFTGSDLDPDEVDFLWGKRDRLAEQRVYSRSPLLWRLFEQELIRLEQMLQSGAYYSGSRVEKQLSGLHRLAEVLGRPTTVDPVPAFTLPLAVRYNQVPDSPESVRQMALFLGARSALGQNPELAPRAATRPSRDAASGGAGADQAAGESSGPALNAAGGSTTGTATAQAGGAAQGGATAQASGAASAEGAAQGTGSATGAAAGSVSASGSATGATTGGAPPVPAADPTAAPAPKIAAPTPAPTMPEGPTTYSGRAIAAWYRLLEPVSAETPAPLIDDLLDFVGPPEAGQDPGFVEMHFLEMLSRHLDRDPSRRPKFEYLQAAAASRNLAEQASLPLDLRTHYWVRPLVDEGDDVRREAEDELFVGASDLLTDAVKNWDAAHERYVAGARQGVVAAEAFAVRDRAWAELPYLAQWFARRMSPYRVNEGELWDQRINGLLLPTINAAHELGEAIENNLSSTELAPLVAKADRVKRGCDDLRRIFDDHWERVLGRAPMNAETLHEIHYLLRSPLIPATQRRELRYLAARIALKLHHDVPEAPLAGAAALDDEKAQAEAERRALAAGEKPSLEGKPLPYFSRQVGWDDHPALAILSRQTFALDRVVPAASARGDSDKETDHLIDHAQWGEEIRLSLAALWPAVDEWLSQSDVALKSASSSELDARRLRGSAERLLRSAAVLSIDKPRRDPTTAVQELDLHNLMTWYAARTLEDFWGPVRPQGQSYFVAAAVKYLNAAGAFISSGTDLRVGTDRKLWDELKRLERVALAAVQAETRNLFRADAEKERQIDVAIAPGLPPGRAAVWLYDPQSGPLPVRSTGSRSNRTPISTLSDVYRVPVTVKGGFTPGEWRPSRDEVPFYFELDSLETVGPRLEAAALYRGHFFNQPFLLESRAGVAVDYQPPPTEPARLTVFGQARQGGSVMFVLDCSMSMAERTPVESPEESGGAPAEEERLTLAKRALRELLDRLSVEEDYKVGVSFYGHRVGYNLRNKDEVLTQEDYEAARIPRDLLPAQDVELVWPLGRYDQSHNGVTNRLLDLIKPWGETPLYLSIARGLEQFGKDDPGRRQSLVVITDGLDNVWQPANSQTPKTTKADVLALLRRKRVPIYILGFDIADREKSRAARDFGELAQASGGEYFEVNDAATLAQALSRSLGPGTFSIDIHGGRGDHVAQALLGEPVELPVRPGRRETYDVTLQVGEVRSTAEVELIGGEAVEMFWNESRKRLEFRRYLKGQPRFSAPTPDDPTAERRYLVGAHLPTWNGPLLTFPVSFQNADETAFSPAPSEAWIEVTPVLPQGPGAPLVFYDLKLEPGKPAPVALCQADGWPLDARRARVHAWWKYRLTQPDVVVTVGDATASREPGQQVLQIPGAPDVTYSVEVAPAKSADEPLKVIVFENYRETATDLAQVKIELDPPAASVLRRFDRENRITIHEFSYPGVDESLIDQHRVAITRRASLMKDSFQNAEPVEVNVVTLPGVVR